MAGGDRNDGFDNLTARDSFTDPGGTTHTGALGGGDGNASGGTATKSGDGSTTTFTLTHSLGELPTTATVIPLTEDASADHYISNVTSSDLAVTYPSAPPSGTDNLKWHLIVVADGGVDGGGGLSLENTDGTTLLTTNTLHAGAELAVSDDGDGTATLNLTNTSVTVAGNTVGLGESVTPALDDFAEPSSSVSFGVTTIDNIWGIRFRNDLIDENAGVTVYDQANTEIPQARLGGPASSLSSYPLPTSDLNNSSVTIGDKTILLGETQNTFNYFDFENNERDDFGGVEGRLYWDKSAGLYIKSGNTPNATTSARAVWSSENVTPGNALSVSFDGEDLPTIAVDESGISHDNIGGVSSGDHHNRYSDEEAQDAVGAALGVGLDYDDANNTITENVVASGTATLSSGAAVVSTGVTTTGTHVDIYLDPSGGGANSANVKAAARAFWDNSAGEYKVEILEDGTSVGSPDIGYEVVAR